MTGFLKIRIKKKEAKSNQSNFSIILQTKNLKELEKTTNLNEVSSANIHQHLLRIIQFPRHIKWRRQWN